jgi:cytochrome b subunit of formate dehydrogenase
MLFLLTGATVPVHAFSHRAGRPAVRFGSAVHPARLPFPDGSPAALPATVALLGTLLLGAFLLAATAPAALADDPHNCLFCHQYRGLSRYDAEARLLHVFFVQPEYTDQRLGPHARITCTDCHPGQEVSVVPHSPVSRVNCTQACHLTSPNGGEQRFSHANVAEMLDRSAHPSKVLTQTQLAGGRPLAEGQADCPYCPDEPVFRNADRVMPVLAALGGRTFDRCNVCHQKQIPADIAYDLRHIASRLQPSRPSMEMAQVCAVCHSDPVLRKRYEMHDAVASYLRSYHGKAALLGDPSTADCLSCHVAAGSNAHLMLKPDNPASSVNRIRVPDTCRTAACHPGADVRIGSASVHLDLPQGRGSLEFWVAAAFILLTALTFGPSMLICVLELFSLVIGRHERREAHLESLTRSVLDHPEGRRRLIRFTVSQRVQHWVLVLLFTMLALTGFPLKFADRDWARTVIDSLGGLDSARAVHHWGGLALMTGLFLHLSYVLWTLTRKRREARQAGADLGLVGSVTSLPMWVSPQDAIKMVQLLAYLVRLRKERPAFGRFNVAEKFEYIGVFWGTILLGITGLLLWGEQISSHFIPGRVLNLALIAHTYEAFLAIIHVGILHMVAVVLSPTVFPLSPAMITGNTPVRELAEGHSEQVMEAARSLRIAPPEI